MRGLTDAEIALLREVIAEAPHPVMSTSEARNEGEKGVLRELASRNLVVEVAEFTADTNEQEFVFLPREHAALAPRIEKAFRAGASLSRLVMS